MRDAGGEVTIKGDEHIKIKDGRIQIKQPRPIGPSRSAGRVSKKIEAAMPENLALIQTLPRSLAPLRICSDDGDLDSIF